MSAGVSEGYSDNINSTNVTEDGVKDGPNSTSGTSNSDDDLPVTTAEANVADMFEGSYNASLTQIVFLGVYIFVKYKIMQAITFTCFELQDWELSLVVR